MRRTLADRLMLFPSVGPEAVDGIRREEIPFREGSLELWSANTPTVAEGGPEKFVLCFYGNGSRADREFKRMPQIWGRLPVTFYAVNYPGFGRSSGPATLKTLAEASLAAFDAVHARSAGCPVILAGHSMGTVPALAVAARREAAGLVLHNPPPLRQLIYGRFGWWNLWLGAAAVARSVPQEIDSVANARRCAAPAVFLLAAHDGLVTPRYQRMVLDAYGGPTRKVDLPDARHNTPVQEADLPAVNPAIDWLWAQAVDPAAEHKMQ